jgi:hypothetical protein
MLMKHELLNESLSFFYIKCCGIFICNNIKKFSTKNIWPSLTHLKCNDSPNRQRYGPLVDFNDGKHEPWASTIKSNFLNTL